MLKIHTQKVKSITPFKYPYFHTKLFANTWIITILLPKYQCVIDLQWDPRDNSYDWPYTSGYNNKDRNLIELLNKCQMIFFFKKKPTIIYAKTRLCITKGVEFSNPWSFVTKQHSKLCFQIAIISCEINKWSNYLQKLLNALSPSFKVSRNRFPSNCTLCI